MWVRGLSQADVEALFLETVGDRVISRTGVSELSRQLQADFEAWPRRDLSALKVVSLGLDAIYLAVRQGTDEQEGVLCAYGILESGQQVLLSLALGSRESSDAWLRVLHDLTARGLAAPLLGISDGPPGLRKAGGRCSPGRPTSGVGCRRCGPAWPSCRRPHGRCSSPSSARSSVPPPRSKV
ncbi:transposase [Nitrospira sp. Kam-Ns4a]